MKITGIWLSILVSLLLGMRTAQAGFLVFGDSLSDTGNVIRIDPALFDPDPTTNPTFPTPPYFQGRFSNGPTWIETVAAEFGQAVDPFLAGTGGTNYAFGGAESGFGRSSRNTPNVGEQIGSFKAINPGPSPIPANTIVSLWVGSNDYNNVDPTVPPPPPAQVVANISGHINELAGLGGRRFIVPNLPPLGFLPAALQTGNPVIIATLNALAQEFNRQLALELASLEANLGIIVHQPDIYAGTQAIMNDPPAFGLTNVTDPAFNLAAYLAGDPYVVPNPDEYLYWDPVHPSGAGHALIAQTALAAAVPEPASLAIWAALGTAIIFVSWHRRRLRATT